MELAFISSEWPAEGASECKASAVGKVRLVFHQKNQNNLKKEIRHSLIPNIHFERQTGTAAAKCHDSSESVEVRNQHRYGSEKKKYTLREHNVSGSLYSIRSSSELLDFFERQGERSEAAYCRSSWS